MSKRKARFTTTADYLECLGLFARLSLERRTDILTRLWVRDRYLFDAVELSTMITRRNATALTPPDQKSMAAGERVE